MHSRLLTLLLLSLSLATALLPTRQVYQGPLGTWLENLAVRHDGSILLTSAAAPTLSLLDPNTPNPQPTLLHTFPSALITLGITETTPDTFYVAAGNATGATGGVLGSFRLYRVKFRGRRDMTPKIELAADLAQVQFVNGLTTLNARTVLAADSQKGVVWTVDVLAGTSKIVIQDPLLKPAPAFPTIGINGLVAQGNVLYFTNTAQTLLAKIAIKPDGTPVGPPATVVASFTEGPDDLALDWQGNAYVTTGGGNSIEEVQRNGTQFLIAGNLNSTEIAEPTSAKFGRTWKDKGILYVTTAGGLGIPVQTVDGPQKVGGQLVAIDVKW